MSYQHAPYSLPIFCSESLPNPCNACLSHMQLQQDLNLDGVKELLAVASQYSFPLDAGKLPSPLKAVNPVIVVEGMDAAGIVTNCNSSFHGA